MNIRQWIIFSAAVFFCCPGMLLALDIKKVDVVPLIDGKLEEGFWQKATESELLDNAGGSRLKNRTMVRLAYDDKNLYVAFKCYESQMNNLKTSWKFVEERDSSIWNDDCVEVFLDPLSGKKKYYHLIINSAGVIYDAKDGDILWESNIKAATLVDKDFWTVEMSIPFSDFGYAPLGGEVWKGNLCREEKPANELSCLSPAFGAFSNPEKFTDLRFEREKGPFSFSLESLADNNENKIKLVFDNQTKSSKKLKVTVNCLQKGERFFSDVKELDIPISAKKELLMPYQTNSEEQAIDFAILDLTENKCIYRNRFLLAGDASKIGESKRVWNVKNPLYQELFSSEPSGLVKEGAMSWFSGRMYQEMRPFAMQYGLRYVYDEMYQQCAENKLHPIVNDIVLTGSFYNALFHDRKHKVKEIILADSRGSDSPIIDGWPFLPDPIAIRHYLERVKKVLKGNSDVIWAVSAGDEIQEGEEKRGVEFFEKMKATYPYIVEVDKEIKEKYGAGKYGIPLSMNDKDPYRWIAYRRWLTEKLANVLAQLYSTVKEANPEIHVISYDPRALHRPYDLSLWRKHCDIVTWQLYPKSNSNRADFGFITKLIKDISGVEEVWPCAHVENYAASFSPEEVLELMSQIFRNGGTGFHYYLLDTIGDRQKKKYMHDEYYGAPERWQIEMELVKEAGRMKKLRFPAPDCAIFYSCDSYASQPENFLTNEIEFAYTFLGPMAGSWFTFFDDNQVYRKEKDLSSYKAVYIPYAKYERVQVVEGLEEYVKKGGILISGDPEVFSFDVDGTSRDQYREKIFGVKINGEMRQNEITYKGKNLPVYAPAYDITLLPETEVLAAFANGKPAIVAHKYGKGKAFYFAFNPFTVKGIAKEEWQAFFKGLQVSMGLKVDNDIWRFKFPANLIKKPVVPEGRCLTNNYIFWRGFEPVDICNLNTGGAYSYSLCPDKIKEGKGTEEKIQFPLGNLTDRRDAPAAGNVDRGESKLSDWIVSWKNPDRFSITFDFNKSYDIRMIRLFYSGQLPDISLSASKDGENWGKLDAASSKEAFTEDVLDKVLSGDWGTFRYLRIEFGERDKDKYLTLSEIEVWTK